MPFRIEKWAPLPKPPAIPLDLKIVAVLFIIEGVLAAIDVVVCLTQSHVNLNLGVLGIWIGLGLMKLRRGWRTCALVFIWLGLIGIPLICLVFLLAQNPLEVAVLGRFAGYTSPTVGVMAGLLLFALTLWKYMALTRPAVRTLFGLDTSGT